MRPAQCPSITGRQLRPYLLAASSIIIKFKARCTGFNLAKSRLVSSCESLTVIMFAPQVVVVTMLPLHKCKHAASCQYDFSAILDLSQTSLQPVQQACYRCKAPDRAAFSCRPHHYRKCLQTLARNSQIRWTFSVACPTKRNYRHVADAAELGRHTGARSRYVPVGGLHPVNLFIRLGLA